MLANRLAWRASPLVCAVLLATPPVRAAEQQGSQVQQARAFADQALKQYDLGHFSEAARLYEAAYDLKPVPALLFNVGQCRRQLGELRGAAVAYRSFLRGDPDHESAPTARRFLAQIEDALPKTAPPERPAATSAANPPPVPAQALPAVGAAPDRPRKRWPALAAGGTAVALLAVAATQSLAAQSATDRLARLHQQGAVSPADDARLRADAESKHARARVLYVVSAVAAAAGFGLYFAF